MKPGNWWRAQNNCVDHAKLILLNDRAFRNWFNLMCIASDNGGVLPDLWVVAIKLRMKEPRAAAAIAELVSRKLFDLRQDGKYEPHDWDTWQFKMKDTEESGENAAGEHRGKYVYVIGTKPGAPVKLGISKNPWARMAELQTSHPDKLLLIASFRTRGPSEADLHVLLSRFRRQGEWFDLPESLLDLIVSSYQAKSDYASLLLLLRSSYVAAPNTDTKTNLRTFSTGSVERAKGLGNRDLTLSPSALASKVGGKVQ